MAEEVEPAIIIRVQEELEQITIKGEELARQITMEHLELLPQEIHFKTLDLYNK